MQKLIVQKQSPHHNMTKSRHVGRDDWLNTRNFTSKISLEEGKIRLLVNNQYIKFILQNEVINTKLDMMLLQNKK